MAIEQALARLQRALEDLAGSRDMLAESLDQAIDASLKCVGALEQTLAAPSDEQV